MKLKTSFFNPAVLKKDITRFAPLWGLYTVFMLLFLVMTWGDGMSADEFARNADNIMMAMGVVNFFYAGFVSLALFGDLFKTRLVGALHALPLRREGWFLTHLTAGMLFCLIPNALGAVLSAAMLGKFAYLAYLWLGLMIMQYICFFGIGAFSAQCAGNSLGSIAVYGLTNFLSVLVLWMVKCFYEPVLFGITVNGGQLVKFSPVVGFSMQNYVDVDFVYNSSETVFKGFVGSGWLYALLTALAGLALLVAALFMYRRRKLESAGDLIAFRPAGPVFLVLYSLCVGAVLYLMGDVVDSNLGYTFLIIGLGIGWFTGQMLLQKRVNVFRWKAFIGYGVLVFVFFLSVTVVWLDPVGVTRYVPQADQVQKAVVSPYTSDYYFINESAVVSDPADIEKLTQIHEDLIQERSERRDRMVFRIQYTMKTGVEVERNYYLDVESENGQWVKKIYSSPETVLGSSNPDRLKQTVQLVELYSYSDTYFPQISNKGEYAVLTAGYAGLIDALIADCNAGNIAQIWDYHSDEDVAANLRIKIGTGYQEIRVYESCTNTIQYLKSLGENLKPIE